MSIKEFEQKYNVKLIPKSNSKLMKVVGFFSKKFMTNFWTTYRLPFNDPIISYPSSVVDPMAHTSLLQHELMHVEYMRSTWGLLKMFLLYFFLPLPILFSGRWLIERDTYLLNIIEHNYPIEAVVNTLWKNYGFAWPKFLMRSWFNKKVNEHKDREKINVTKETSDPSK